MQKTLEMRADVAIIGGGVGGCAAALAALRLGLRVVMSEACEWIGGQLTSQAVPPDEHPWIEHFGCTRSYRRLRDEIRLTYKRTYPLTRAAREARFLNPGTACVSAICHEPKVSLAVLEAWLRPYESGGRLTILRRHVPVKARTDGDRVASVTLEGPESQVEVHAPWFIDATEQGDLLPLAGVEHVSGAEAQGETGEPHAAREAAPDNLQAVSWCFVVDHRPGEDHVIDRPVTYELWRDYYPPLTPDWGNRLLSWAATHPITLQTVERSFSPIAPQPERGPMDLWTFRRIADRRNFEDGAYDSDIVLVNWPQIDYLPGTLLHADAEQHREGARQLSLSMLYWMQTEAPRPDGGTGWPGLRLRGDVTGTPDGLAMAPYVREARRIKGLFTVLEQHVGTEARMRETGLPEDQVRAADFPDTVGVGAYRIDLHPSTGGDNYIDVSALPFQIPLGALIPVRVENLLAGGKNLSVTHITNGCYRLHPVEWNVGESAGLLAAFCHGRGLQPRQVRESGALLGDLQALLASHGVELHWPRVTPL